MKKNIKNLSLKIIFVFISSGDPDEMSPSVILLPANPASFAHNFVSGMQSFYFSKSQDAIVLQTCH